MRRRVRAGGKWCSDTDEETNMSIASGLASLFKCCVKTNPNIDLLKSIQT